MYLGLCLVRFTKPLFIERTGHRFIVCYFMHHIHVWSFFQCASMVKSGCLSQFLSDKTIHTNWTSALERAGHLISKILIYRLECRKLRDLWRDLWTPSSAMPHFTSAAETPRMSWKVLRTPCAMKVALLQRWVDCIGERSNGNPSRL